MYLYHLTFLDVQSLKKKVGLATIRVREWKTSAEVDSSDHFSDGDRRRREGNSRGKSGEIVICFACIGAESLKKRFDPND